MLIIHEEDFEMRDAIKVISSWMDLKDIMLSEILKKTLESPLDSKKIEPVNPKGNQS